MYGQFSKRWGEEREEVDSIDLLAKKDQQIRKLQAELQEERRRADNLLKMLDSYKSLNKQTEQSSEGLRSEMTRRIKAEEEVKRLKNKNEELEKGVKELMLNLQQKLNQKKERETYFQQTIQED